jgi:hypothetical protein
MPKRNAEMLQPPASTLSLPAEPNVRLAGAEHYQAARYRAGKTFQSERSRAGNALWPEAERAIDIQNLFCETDKYARKAHPEFNIVKKGKKLERIKQPFKVTGPLLQPFFPPKWGIKAIL